MQSFFRKLGALSYVKIKLIIRYIHQQSQDFSFFNQSTKLFYFRGNWILTAETLVFSRSCVSGWFCEFSNFVPYISHTMIQLLTSMDLKPYSCFLVHNPKLLSEVVRINSTSCNSSIQSRTTTLKRFHWLFGYHFCSLLKNNVLRKK